ncbi:T9SS type A sorting domain-containing protein [Adhaeribacter soli]|uniref:T9SS type A sorting domain-containing protein n=1 Tax=Adhaeribacter soli TaxID=2607655 RepID=UPI001CD9A30A
MCTGVNYSKSACNCKVSDASGKVVLSEKLRANHLLNISGLPRGTYFMEVTNGALRQTGGKAIIGRYLS